MKIQNVASIAFRPITFQITLEDEKELRTLFELGNCSTAMTGRLKEMESLIDEETSRRVFLEFFHFLNEYKKELQ